MTSKEDPSRFSDWNRVMLTATSTDYNPKLIEISFVALLVAVMISLLLPAANNFEESSLDRRSLVSTPNQSQFVSKNKSVPHRISRYQTEKM